MTMSRDRALQAIVDQLDRVREEALTTAKTDFAAQYPGQPVPAFPAGGPVLPLCRYDDPRDTPPQPGKIMRELTLFTETAGEDEAYVNDGVEAMITATLEWLLLIPSEHHSEARAIREKGLSEIEAALLPCQSRLEDPDTGDLLAITFDFGSPADFQTHDVGDAWVMAVYIPLRLTLDAQTILS